MTRSLVTGGGGFLGRHIVYKLLERGDQVAVLGRSSYPDLASKGVKCIAEDIRNRKKLPEHFRDIDEVYHTAAIAGIWGPWKDFYSINVEGTQNVIEACTDHQVSKLIFTSSPSVIYDGKSQKNLNEDTPYPKKFLAHYPKTKMLAEKAVLEANGRRGLCTIALRPHLIWGPGDGHLIPRIVARAKKGQLRQVGDARNRVDVIYVENAATAHLAAAKALGPQSSCGGKAYFVGQGEPVNLWEFIGKILSKADAPRVTKKMSFRSAYRIGSLMETFYKVLGKEDEPRMTRFLACQLATDHYYDCSRAEVDLSYQAKVSMQSGLDKLFEEK